MSNCFSKNSVTEETHCAKIQCDEISYNNSSTSVSPVSYLPLIKTLEMIKHQRIANIFWTTYNDILYDTNLHED